MKPSFLGPSTCFLRSELTGNTAETMTREVESSHDLLVSSLGKRAAVTPLRWGRTLSGHLSHLS
jgi:hypothetical protein